MKATRPRVQGLLARLLPSKKTPTPAYNWVDVECLRTQNHVLATQLEAHQILNDAADSLMASASRIEVFWPLAVLEQVRPGLRTTYLDVALTKGHYTWQDDAGRTVNTCLLNLPQTIALLFPTDDLPPVDHLHALVGSALELVAHLSIKEGSTLLQDVSLSGAGHCWTLSTPTQ